MSRHGVLPRALLGTRQALVALSVVGVLAVVAIVGVATHGPAPGTRTRAASAMTPGVAPGTVATRWWSVPGAARGSRIDPAHPLAVADRLRPSRSGYCEVLSQTVAAGHSALPDLAATDPALVVTARAFLGELTALAPPAVHPAWQTAGRALLAIVESRGDLSRVHPASGSDASGAATGALARIAADARSACHVDLAAHRN